MVVNYGTGTQTGTRILLKMFNYELQDSSLDFRPMVVVNHYILKQDGNLYVSEENGDNCVYYISKKNIDTKQSNKRNNQNSKSK